MLCEFLCSGILHGTEIGIRHRANLAVMGLSSAVNFYAAIVVMLSTDYQLSIACTWSLIYKLYKSMVPLYWSQNIPLDGIWD